MSLNEITDMAGGLLAITAVNAIIAFGITFTYLIIRDKFAARRRELMRRRDK